VAARAVQLAEQKLPGRHVVAALGMEPLEADDSRRGVRCLSAGKETGNKG
jgi:hypothetical protein